MHRQDSSCVEFMRLVDCPLSRRSIQMSEQKFPRRTLLKGALLGVAAVPVSALLSRTADAAGAKVSPSEPQAKSLGYVEDAATVDAKANPNHKPGQMCANCLQAPTYKAGMT